jgi:hypothetical protein
MAASSRPARNTLRQALRSKVQNVSAKLYSSFSSLSFAVAETARKRCAFCNRPNPGKRGQSVEFGEALNFFWRKKSGSGLVCSAIEERDP